MLLSERERNVTELCSDLGMPNQPTVSHHLALLRHGRLIEPRRSGKQNFYVLTEAGRELAQVVNTVGCHHVGETLSVSEKRRGPERREEVPQSTGWESKFSQLRELPEGWNGYAAPAPTKTAILALKSFVDFLLRADFEPSRLAPSAVGGVAVTHRRGSKKVYVEFYNDGRVLALFSDDVSDPVIKRVDPGCESYKELIAEMRGYLDG
jgi:DNA-binding transcriptional ArsR family regulator